jgi:hypothetical protein
METINTIELKDAAIFPDEAVLQGVLGDSYAAYCEMIRLFDQKAMTHEWRYYHDGKAWLCKVQYKKRTIVWMSAWKGYMQASVYIPEGEIEPVCGLPISESQKQKFRQTKNTGKSRPCIFEVRNVDILPDLEQVMQFKIALK